jgi:hypothetical protein
MDFYKVDASFKKSIRNHKNGFIKDQALLELFSSFIVYAIFGVLSTATGHSLCFLVPS